MIFKQLPLYFEDFQPRSPLGNALLNPIKTDGFQPSSRTTPKSPPKPTFTAPEKTLEKRPAFFPLLIQKHLFLFEAKVKRD